LRRAAGGSIWHEATTMDLPAIDMRAALKLADGEFTALSRIVYQRWGINLTDKKRELVRSRLAKVVRRHGYESFGTLVRAVQVDGSGALLQEVVDAISTNVTSFFREQHHFDFLHETVVPEFIARARKKSGPTELRVWSAGCSTGAEAYSIAMTLEESIPASADIAWEILATDVSQRVMDIARRGTYPLNDVRGVSPVHLRKFFLKGTGKAEGYVRAVPALRERVTVRPLNLMEAWCHAQPFTVIFCRNVMIYFDKPTQQRVVERYRDSLAAGGYLFVGHSETITTASKGWKTMMPTVYRKA
jgi:chemotaxis protein methyltransferase CheR